jgi:hypothetical protein
MPDLQGRVIDSVRGNPIGPAGLHPGRRSRRWHAPVARFEPDRPNMPVMERVSFFRRHAAEYRRLANQAATGELRQQLHELADQCELIADSIEELNKLTDKPTQ